MPLAAMTYVNPVLAYGLEAFAGDARAAGLDGLIVPDLPSSEAAGARRAMNAIGLDFIPLVAPTTRGERLAQICEQASGFIYCVSVTGVTGARDALAPGAIDLLQRVRGVSPLPRALGFGLSRAEHVRALAGHAELAVVGSALIDAIDAAPSNPAGALTAFVASLLAG